jgi:uncharacterized protein
MRRIAVSVVVLGVIGTSVLAQSDGPDYFRITGLKKEDRVNVRRAPEKDAKVVGKISKDADGIKNLGCKGPLSAKQWEKASEAKKKAAERDRWCQVQYKDVKGWVLGRFLVEGTAPEGETQAETKAEIKTEPQPQPPVQQQTMQAPSAALPPMQSTPPSFDCDKAEKTAEKLICAESELAALDREVARLYGLASDVLNATPGFEPLLVSQRKWLDQRNTCFDRDCVVEMHVRRVHQLRTDYRDARRADGRSISMGPLVARCEGFPLPIAVTYVNSLPGYVYLEWLGAYVVIPQVPSGSGASYEGNFATFHTKGEEALVKLPSGKMEMSCKLTRGS